MQQLPMQPVPGQRRQLALPPRHIDMRPCDRCGHTDPHRMIALMALWFAARVGLHLDGGYFYLCPECYRKAMETAAL